LPEVHDALAGVVRAALEPPATSGKGSSNASSASAAAEANQQQQTPPAPVREALFAQVCRNADNFALYEASFQSAGIRGRQEMSVAEQAIPRHFAYDRDSIRLQRHTLQ
jgi:hypothetical protein